MTLHLCMVVMDNIRKWWLLSLTKRIYPLLHPLATSSWHDQDTHIVIQPLLLEMWSLFCTYYHFRTYMPRSGSSHLYKSVLALLYCTLHLVNPLITSIFPLSQPLSLPSELSPDTRCKVQPIN